MISGRVSGAALLPLVCYAAIAAQTGSVSGEKAAENEKARPARAPAGHRLHGKVTSSGAPVHGAVLTLTSLDPKHPEQLVAGVDPSTGEYLFGEVAAGSYKIRAEAPGYRPSTMDEFTMPGDRELNMAFELNPILGPSPRESALCVGLVLLYLLGIVLGRWFGIAIPNQQLLKQRFRALEMRLKTDTVESRYPQTRMAIQELQRCLAEAEHRFVGSIAQGGKWKNVRIGLGGWIFWSGANENAGWAAVHAVERELVAFLAPEERVFVRLQVVEQQLRQVKTPPALALAEIIRTTVDRQTATPVRKPSFRAEAELLAAGIELVHTSRDAMFFSLSEWYSKAFWMTVAALLLILWLTFSAGHAVLFLVGGAGGLLSRLERNIRRSDMPLDYGASWTTLFLSPVLGALSAWIGIALITFLTHSGILGQTWADITWDQPLFPFTLAVGAALGFSERLFDSLVNAVDQKATADISTSASGGGGGSPTSAQGPGTATANAKAAAATDGSSDEVHISGFATEPIHPLQLVKVNGEGLDKVHIQDAKLLDSGGVEQPLDHMTAGGDTLEFVAPEQTGHYKLRLVPVNGQPVEQDFEVVA